MDLIEARDHRPGSPWLIVDTQLLKVDTEVHGMDLEETLYHILEGETVRVGATLYRMVPRHERLPEETDHALLVRAMRGQPARPARMWSYITRLPLSTVRRLVIQVDEIREAGHSGSRWGRGAPRYELFEQNERGGTDDNGK